jgi:uncharacterized protein (TIGR00369 family)
MEYTDILNGIDLDQTLIGALGITLEEITPERVVCKMPVGPKTIQPLGLLHGGASVALAETAASIGAAANINPETHFTAGLEINANHIRGKRDGEVTATATPLHKGRTTMVWDIKITDEENKLICVSRCTMAVVAKK